MALLRKINQALLLLLIVTVCGILYKKGHEGAVPRHWADEDSEPPEDLEDEIPVVICAAAGRMGATMAAINSVYSNTDANVMFYVVGLRNTLPRIRKWIEHSKLREINFKIVEFNPTVLEGKIRPDSSRPELLQPAASSSSVRFDLSGAGGSCDQGQCDAPEPAEDVSLYPLPPHCLVLTAELRSLLPPSSYPPTRESHLLGRRCHCARGHPGAVRHQPGAGPCGGFLGRLRPARSTGRQQAGGAAEHIHGLPGLPQEDHQGPGHQPQHLLLQPRCDRRQPDGVEAAAHHQAAGEVDEEERGGKPVQQLPGRRRGHLAHAHCVPRETLHHQPAVAHPAPGLESRRQVFGALSAGGEAAALGRKIQALAPPQRPHRPVAELVCPGPGGGVQSRPRRLMRPSTNRFYVNVGLSLGSRS
ncbi:glycosyltransferase 8 domain-containing protein 2 isoform X1 [Fukomys damarensis]|uniref:glycosyltransferase 8 domain-containing protein 2 isoform X1 n=1 Tax=Fukomys damarensis TaxID=885580 RepID=UPI00053F46D1|nr:glycosyltransferase 8 domain-containing protein 2 isoform X1 [Fukomys damarensis]